MLENAIVYLKADGHLIVESLVSSVHDSLRMYRDWDYDRDIKVRHDFVPKHHRFQQGLGFTAYPYWAMPT